MRGRVPCCRTRAPLLLKGKSNSSSPPHQAPPPVVSALRAVQAARPHTAAAAVHSLLPAMPLPERPRTVLSHTRTSPPRGREQQLKPSSSSTTTCGECSPPVVSAHHLWCVLCVLGVRRHPTLLPSSSQSVSGTSSTVAPLVAAAPPTPPSNVGPSPSLASGVDARCLSTTLLPPSSHHLSPHP